MRTFCLALALACLFAAAAPVATATTADGAAASTIARGPFVLPDAEQRLLSASGSGRQYRISVAAPPQPPPDGGYPVIYVLDSEAMFLTVVEAVRAYARRRDEGAGLSALVVGVGYPPGSDIGKERTFDFTPLVENRRDGHPTGGGDDFRDFIERDLKPAIARDYPVDAQRQSIMGHSLAGMFVLGTLARRPETFQSYVAMSSSFWFDDHTLVSRIGDFVATRRESDAPVRVLLTVGEFEERLRPEAWAQHPVRASETLARLRARGQVAHARGTAARLAKAPATLVDWAEIAGEDHGTVIPASIGRGVTFILKGPHAIPPVPTAQEYMLLGAEGRYRLRMQVRALPDLHRIPWLNGLKASLEAGLDPDQHLQLHDERQSMDERYGSRPHAVNAD